MNIRRVMRAITTILLGAAIAGCGSHKAAGTGAGGNKPGSMHNTADIADAKKGGSDKRGSARENKNRFWGDIEYEGAPWVSNAARTNDVTQGLYNRHIAVWASHGRYYDATKGEWRWQRPLLFGTTEDLFTQTIVVPYLIPMLEKAGANVFTPRERDWQRNEIIIDNDDETLLPYYTETGNTAGGRWKDAGTRGFARRAGVYHDNENPFEAGTARMAKAAKNGECCIEYQPSLPEAGKYAVYVSYVTKENSVDDARYTVYHRGGQTEIRVNQRMGGGTWVYIGTFDFDRGCNAYNRVVLSNASQRKGVVTADAVRFGGGMGNIERGGSVSGMPRCVEGARYYAQWAGAPYSVYSTKNGSDDYADDINARSLMTNWLSGGSCYVPGRDGLGVPVELSLAVHSDAGVAADGMSLIGSLSICTTGYNDGKLASGISRQASKNFAARLLEGLRKDITYSYGHWETREIYDRNYSETRLPAVPSAIIETMSHQNFPDMRMGQDPNVRFTMARSIYKTILRFISEGHGSRYAVAPLTPEGFSVEFTSADEVTLKWVAKDDPQEPTARPTHYYIYTAMGTGGFDNGTKVTGTSYKMKLIPGVMYGFRISAGNKGGESFPTETLAAVCERGATKSVLIVNGFTRLSAPAVTDNAGEQGFDFNADPGVSYGPAAGWSGRQICFDKSKMGIEGPGGLGYSGTEWQGMFIAGNDFDYVRTHAEAMTGTNRYNIASCSRKAVETGAVNVMKYHCVDLILGLEKYDSNSPVYYKTFTPQMQHILREYTRSGGAVMVSGSYIGSDMTNETGKAFLCNVLKLRHDGNELNNKDMGINGMGTAFEIYRNVNEKHYAAVSPDVIQPVSPAYCALTYSDGRPASVAYSGTDYRAFVMGFPFECITNAAKRAAVMRGVLTFLIE